MFAAAGDADVEVPEVGWMWESSKGVGKGSNLTKSSLRADKIKPKKSLGQNFVVNDMVLEAIVRHAKISLDDLLIEVGPGTGNLTKHLLSKGATITAIEKDDVLFQRLTHEYKEEPRLRLVNADVLNVNLRTVIEGMLQWGRTEDVETSTSESASTTSASSSRLPAGRTPRRVKIVANLPYNITTDFIKQALPLGDVVSELSLMLQDEAALRLVHSAPGKPDYRSMNLRVQYYSKPKYCMTISKEHYFPVPGVDGGLVTFALLAPEARIKVASERGFMKMITQAFSQRRKKMRNTLQPGFSGSQVEQALAQSGLNRNARAQDLSLEQFATLYGHLLALAAVPGSDAVMQQEEAGDEALSDDEADDGTL